MVQIADWDINTWFHVNEKSSSIRKKIWLEFRLRKKCLNLFNRIDPTYKYQIFKLKYHDGKGPLKNENMSTVALMAEVKWVVMEENDFDIQEKNYRLFLDLVWL